jgi:hypothetical protein
VDSDTRLAADHGPGNVLPPENTLIPTGWHIVKSGPCRGSDKFWSTDKLAWLPITKNSGFMAEKFLAVIRKDEYGL